LLVFIHADQTKYKQFSLRWVKADIVSYYKFTGHYLDPVLRIGWNIN